MLCSAIYVLLCASIGETRYPTRLQNLLDAGKDKSSEVEWTLSWAEGVNNGLVERFLTRTSEDSIWQSNLGDENGFHAVQYTKEPQGHSEEEMREYQVPREKSAGTRSSMIYGDQLWYLPRSEFPLSGYVQPLSVATAYRPFRPTAIGLSPGMVNELDSGPFRIPYGYADGIDSAAFDERKVLGGSSITAEYGGGRFRLTWQFDDRVGGMPVKAMLERDGVLVYFSETEYVKQDDRWVPEQSRFYRGDSATPYKIAEMKNASFNKPKHITDFDPSDMGALYGTQFLTRSGVQYWGGSGLLSDSEFWELVYIYNVLPHPQIIEMIAREGEMSREEYERFLQRGAETRRAEYRKSNYDEPWTIRRTKTELEDEWDIYLKKFLDEHKLPEAAVERAREVTKKAKEIRDARREKDRADKREAEKKGNQARLKEFEQEEEKMYIRLLVKPLDKIARSAQP